MLKGRFTDRKHLFTVPFHFCQNKGMLYFDDFTVHFSKINYVMRHKYVQNSPVK